MITVSALLLLPRVEATLVILSLLLASAIIGYVTAWLYFRNKFRNETEELESIISRQNREAVTLKEENSELQKSLVEKDREIDRLTKEIKAQKGTGSVTPQDSSYQHGDNLRMISGIGPFIEDRLHAMDIYTFKQISNFSKKDIETMNIAIEYFTGRIERDEWVEQAKELVLEEASDAALDRVRARKTQIYFSRIGIASKLEADDLTLISGIGGWIEKKLNALDIFTFKQIANFTKDDIVLVAEAMEFFPGRIERDEWVHQAKFLMKIEGKKDDLQKRLKEKKSTIQYTRLGVADKYNANNLTLINGISLWIEERLNLLNIFTFEQISRFLPEDVRTIAKLLDIPESRIQKENWIGQAKKLLKK